MPELTWIGKDKIVNHHHDVPFRILEKQYTFGAENSGNKIIHGDNLAALKSLLPEYEGRVKCVYIDPPYNTGNEGWVYNDNVNDPKLKKWLNEVVGKEGEDLSRHDKWLCMMYPRLKLLRRLLKANGSIWISIDDIEGHYLKVILDEIFGRANFVGNVLWQKRTSPDARLEMSGAHDHILIYAKDARLLRFNKIALTPEQADLFTNPDDDSRGEWTSTDFTAQGYRPNQMYEITTPGGAKYKPPPGRCWANIESEFNDLRADGRIWFGSNGKARPRTKTFLSESDGISAWTWWTNKEVGHNQESKKEINEILGTDNSFDTPKPERLINRIIRIATDPNDIILDSFSGSGTTAHAVLKLNSENQEGRNFILIEQEDYADSLTAERVKRVIKGYEYSGIKEIVLLEEKLTMTLLKKSSVFIEKLAEIKLANAERFDSFKNEAKKGVVRLIGKKKVKEKVSGLGGAFDYYSIGKPLFHEDGNLNEEIGVEEIRKYVSYSENIAAENQLPANNKHSSYVLGIQDETAYFFYYEKDRATTLDLEFLSRLKFRPKEMVFYADICLLNRLQLQKFGIIFKKIPRDITRF